MRLLVLVAIVLEVHGTPPPCHQHTALVPDEFGHLMGRTKLADPGGDLRINVTIYTKAKLSREQLSSGELDLVDTKRRSPFLTYYLHFPTNNPLPEIGMITLNYQVICQDEVPTFDKYLTQTNYIQDIVGHKYASGSQIRLVHKITSSLSSKTFKRVKPLTPNSPHPPNIGRASRLHPPTPGPEALWSVGTKPPQTINSKKRQCGRSIVPSQLIYGGMPVTRGAWPWLANVYLDCRKMFFCGSTIISMRHVITAAHCLFNPYTFRPFKMEDMVVALGQYNRTTMTEKGLQPSQVKQIVVHPSFDPTDPFLNGDIAVLLLTLEVKYSQYVRPICLWDTDSRLELIIGREATVVGWGVMDNMTMSDIPYLAVVPIVSQKECYDSHPTFNEVDHDLVLCGGRRTGTGPCMGDSGSGLALQQTHTDGSTQWYLRGVVSFNVRGNDSVCHLDGFSLFTDVTKYSQWIKKVTRLF